MKNTLPSELMEVLNQISIEGGRGLIVGGWVRDSLLGIESKDIDVEVYNLDVDTLYHTLSYHGTVHAVGSSFGVLKLKSFSGNWYDFSLPRRENKQGRGHKGFQVKSDPTMTPKEAAARRDFTINSMAYDPLRNELLDFYGGKLDLENKVLFPTSPAFVEDPLRVLRAMQFTARFNMEASYSLKVIANLISDEYYDLSIERVWEEWKKLCEKGKYPSKGLKLLRDTGWVNHYPELAAIIGIQQTPEWHPEGDVWNHTLACLDAAAEIAEREKLAGEDRIVFMLATLTHDFGKATTTEFIDGKWKAHGHDVAGVPLATSFLLRIGCPFDIIEKVKKLVRWHMAVTNDSISKKFVRKLSLDLPPANIDQLILLFEADHSGRPPLPKGIPENAFVIKELAEQIGVVSTPLAPILKGRHLLERGWKPGIEIGVLLKEAFQAQVEGLFDSEETATKWLDNRLARN